MIGVLILCAVLLIAAFAAGWILGTAAQRERLRRALADVRYHEARIGAQMTPEAVQRGLDDIAGAWKNRAG